MINKVFEMKNNIFFLFLFITTLSWSQTTPESQQKTPFRIGLSTGLLHGSGILKGNDFSVSSSNTGFYLGVYSDIKVKESIGLIAELDYGNLNSNGIGFFSTRLKYYVLPKFNIQIGPQITYLLRRLTDDVKRTGIDASLGLGYNITDNFKIHARYSHELTNRLIANDTDQKAKLKWLHVGIGYSF